MLYPGGGASEAGKSTVAKWFRLWGATVIDADAIVRELVASMLTRTGYHVLSASTGTEALELLQQAQGQIDVLVTDMVMPGVGGRELAERVISTTPRLPIATSRGR